MTRRRTSFLVCFTLASIASCAKHTPPPKNPEPPPREEEPPPPPPRASHEDEMSVTGTLGTLADEDIAQTFRGRWTDVTRCLRETPPKLGYLVGKVELKLRVGQDGAAKTAHVQDSSLGHYGAEHCLLELAQSLRFPSPRGGAEAEFSYPIEYKPPRTAAVVMDWPKERVSPEKMANNLISLQMCRTASASQPAAAHPKKKHGHHAQATMPKGPLRPVPAHLRMTMYVAPGGKVITAGLSADGPVDPGIASCYMTSAGGWKLDDPGGRVAKLSFEVAP